MKIIVCLSYFNRKEGPLVFYSYPEEILDDNLSVKIANMMDQMVNEGGFIYSFEKLNSMNYNFEINSDWARGNKESLMVTIIFNQHISPEIEESSLRSCYEFSEMLKTHEDIYTAFYNSELSYFEKNNRERIISNSSLVKLWVKELYQATVEDTLEKSEEKLLENFLNKKHVYFTIKKLSKNPITLIELRDWFKSRFSHKNFSKMIESLINKQIIFIDKKKEGKSFILLSNDILYLQDLIKKIHLLNRKKIRILKRRVKNHFTIFNDND